jgi:hypothetical protein
MIPDEIKNKLLTFRQRDSVNLVYEKFLTLTFTQQDRIAKCFNLASIDELKTLDEDGLFDSLATRAIEGGKWEEFSGAVLYGISPSKSKS